MTNDPDILHSPHSVDLTNPRIYRLVLAVGTFMSLTGLLVVGVRTDWDWPTIAAAILFAWGERATHGARHRRKIQTLETTLSKVYRMLRKIGLT